LVCCISDFIAGEGPSTYGSGSLHRTVLHPPSVCGTDQAGFDVGTRRRFRGHGNVLLGWPRASRDIMECRDCRPLCDRVAPFPTPPGPSGARCRCLSVGGTRSGQTRALAKSTPHCLTSGQAKYPAICSGSEMDPGAWRHADRGDMRASQFGRAGTLQCPYRDAWWRLRFRGATADAIELRIADSPEAHVGGARAPIFSCSLFRPRKTVTRDCMSWGGAALMDTVACSVTHVYGEVAARPQCGEDSLRTARCSHLREDAPTSRRGAATPFLAAGPLRVLENWPIACGQMAADEVSAPVSGCVQRGALRTGQNRRCRGPGTVMTNGRTSTRRSRNELAYRRGSLIRA